MQQTLQFFDCPRLSRWIQSAPAVAYNKGVRHESGASPCDVAGDSWHEHGELCRRPSGERGESGAATGADAAAKNRQDVLMAGRGALRDRHVDGRLWLPAHERRGLRLRWRIEGNEEPAPRRRGGGRRAPRGGSVSRRALSQKPAPPLRLV